MSKNELTIVEKKYGADMLRHFGLLYGLSGMGLLLRRLRMEDRSADNIRRAAERGPLVYVLYARSKIDWLALNRTLNQRRLPLASFSWGIRSLWFRPIIDAFRHSWAALKQFFNKPKISETAFLSQSIQRSNPCVVFLVKPSRLSGEPTGVLKELAQLQENLEKPIQLVPISVVWNRRPEKLRSEALRFLLGAQDQPGPIQKLFYVASRDHQPIIQAGAPVDLKELLARYKEAPLERQVRVARLLLRRYLYRQSHVIRGPKIRPHYWMRRLVLDSQEVRDLIKQESAESGKKEAKVRRAVEKTLDHIAARFSFRMVKLVASACNFIWSRIYSGVDIREEDLERLQESIRAGSPIWVPSHRSHLDYLLISSQCYENGLVLPHIVAGENLTFWPMGPIFRRCGAFFIRRSFKASKIFPVLFARYLKQLVRDEFPIEFFIEGGRSRTGKLLPPKLGVLGMVVDAAVDVRADRDVQILPIAISYEQIAEEKAYARELSGEKKKKESIREMLRASRILRKRFGKVYIRVGEPISITKTLQKLEKPWPTLSEERRREMLQETGERIMFGIGKEMLILPTGITALALLSSHTRGVPLLAIQERCQRFDALLRLQGAQTVDSLSHGGWVVAKALERFIREKWIQKMEHEKGEVIKIHDEHRVTLEYYKNVLIHFVAPVSLLASAILANEGQCHADETLLLFQIQTFLLRYEFPTNPALSVEGLAKKAREDMKVYGALSQNDEGRFSVASKELLLELAGLTQNFLESYHLTLRASYAIRARDISLKELPVRIQEFGKARLAIDEIKRPESLSVVNLKNAIKAFREEGVLQLSSDGSGMKFDELAYEQYTQDLDRLML